MRMIHFLQNHVILMDTPVCFSVPPSRHGNPRPGPGLEFEPGRPQPGRLPGDLPAERGLRLRHLEIE